MFNFSLGKSRSPTTSEATSTASSSRAVSGARAEELMKQQDFAGAVVEADRVLDELEPQLKTIQRAALTRGRALITKAMKEMSRTGDLPSREVFDKVWASFELSLKLNPDCIETKMEQKKLKNFYKQMGNLPPARPPKEVQRAWIDVLIVGAGASGVGINLMLTQTFGLHRSKVLCLERGETVGDSFRRWPKEMRFISPSFNQQGWTNSFDLNSISKGTSPAYSLHSEHPSGKEYAAYLAAIVDINKLNVKRETEVVSIRDIREKKELPLFEVTTRSSAISNEGKGAVVKAKTETIICRYVVWAAGEFQYPDIATKKEGKNEEEKKDGEEKKEAKGIPGSEHCIHNSQVRSWAELPGDDFIVIGGYESGVDATYNLAKAGKRVKTLASTATWSVKVTDPSAELAPYTTARLREAMAPGFSPQPQLITPLRVLRVEKAEKGGFNVTAEWKKAEKTEQGLRNMVNTASTQEPGPEGSTIVFHTPNPPVLCTGFEGSVAARASNLFAFAAAGKGCLDGAPLLTSNDESTKVSGVFLSGPMVSHGKKSFCFVYKFRQRFAIVANAICQGLGYDTKAAVAECRKANMYLDDLTCCEDTCGDVC